MHLARDPVPLACNPVSLACACAPQVLLAVLYVLTVVVSKTYAQLEVAEVVPEYHWLELCLYFVAVSIMLDSYYQHLVSSK